MIQHNEISMTGLDPVTRGTILTVANAVLAGVAEVMVSLTYRKQTKTRARVAGKDYVALPGVSCEAQTGTLTVHRRTDNAANRKAGTVGQVYFKIESMTRSDGSVGFGYTNVRPEEIMAFVILSFKTVIPATSGQEAQR